VVTTELGLLLSQYGRKKLEGKAVHAETGAIVCQYTGLFIIPSGISEIDCATTKTDTAERSISISSSKYRLFHNATFFGSCIIYILNTGCAKI
jgi:hypothetical protein